MCNLITLLVYSMININRILFWYEINYLFIYLPIGISTRFDGSGITGGTLKDYGRDREWMKWKLISNCNCIFSQVKYLQVDLIKSVACVLIHRYIGQWTISDEWLSLVRRLNIMTSN